MIQPQVVAQFYHIVLVMFGTLMSIGLGGILVRWIWRMVAEPGPALSHDSRVDATNVRRIWGREWLWWALGVLWTVDGLLQLQPAMPNSAFLEMVIAPTLAGQPGWMVRIMGWGIQTWSNAPITADVVAVRVQCGIGVTLIVGRHRTWGRRGLWLSIVWGLMVWVWGEGLGGILTGQASLVVGDPGSILFYLIGAGLLLLPDTLWTSGSIQRGVRWGMVGLWAWAALVQAWPGSGFWSGNILGAVFRNAAHNAQPAWLSGPIYAMAHAALVHGIWVNAIIVGMMSVLAVLWIGRPYRRMTMGVTVVWLLVLWWLGQDFGVLGGVGTDPNTAPIIGVLLFAAVRSHTSRFQEAPRVKGRLRFPVSQCESAE